MSPAIESMSVTIPPEADAVPKKPKPQPVPVPADGHDCWALTAMAVGTLGRVLLYGVPGVGKTHTATRVGLTAGQPVFSVTLTPDTPAAELRGMFVPRGGEFVWQDGPAVAAWRAGGRLVLNEIDRATADALSLLLAVCDDPQFAQLTLPTNETVRPAAGFTVVATMNATPASLDVALMDRFVSQIRIDRLTAGALEALPADLRSVAAAAALVEADDRRVSFRKWEAFAAMRAAHGAEAALRAVFGARADDVRNTLRIAGVAV